MLAKTKEQSKTSFCFTFISNYISRQSSQLKADVKKQMNLRNEQSSQKTPPVKMGMKKVRSLDVLKSDELGKS